MHPPTGSGNTLTAYFPTEFRYSLKRNRTTSTNTGAALAPTYRGPEAQGQVLADLTSLTAQWETFGGEGQEDLYHTALRGGTITVWKRQAPLREEEHVTTLYTRKPQNRIN